MVNLEAFHKLIHKYEVEAYNNWYTDRCDGELDKLLAKQDALLAVNINDAISDFNCTWTSLVY